MAVSLSYCFLGPAVLEDGVTISGWADSDADEE